MRTPSLTVTLLLLGIYGLADAQCPHDEAQYRLSFDSTWSALTHPQDFPPNPHFSGLVGGVHDASVAFWQVGMVASNGIERMAELGSGAAVGPAAGQPTQRL